MSAEEVNANILQPNANMTTAFKNQRQSLEKSKAIENAFLQQFPIWLCIVIRAQ